MNIQYSMTGSSTQAETISIPEFYNNTDLGQANLGQTFTNQLKNYIIQNSNLAVVAEEGQLHLEGEITGFTLTPISPNQARTTDRLRHAWHESRRSRAAHHR